jgi:hypothetical protein
MCMLPSLDPEGRLIGRQRIRCCLALIASLLMPLVLGWAGPLYLAGALLLGVGFPRCVAGLA